MGERITVDEFMSELVEVFDDAHESIYAGHPDDYSEGEARNRQLRAYTLRRLRVLLSGQRYVNLPDTHDDDGNPWRRDNDD